MKAVSCVVVAVLCAVLSVCAYADAAVIVPPGRAREGLRQRRTREMLTALRVDEARREALRYERRKRLWNEGADALLAGCRVADSSNAVVSVSVDFRSGDIAAEFADSRRIIQRYDPKAKKKLKAVIKRGGEDVRH